MPQKEMKERKTFGQTKVSAIRVSSPSAEPGDFNGNVAYRAQIMKLISSSIKE